MSNIRKQIYNKLFDNSDDRLGAYYVFMLIVISISIIPLAFKSENIVFTIINYASTAIFIIDYFLRWITADFKSSGKKTAAFLQYPFTPMAIVDLLSILPGITALNSGLRLLKLVRFARAIRVFRVFKTFRYSKNINMIIRVFKKSKNPLVIVCTIAVSYILISALIIFNVEPDTFDTFFDAVYWATVSLTTVGYGDIYPTSIIGRVITMASSFFGVAIIAMPTSIITAGIMDEVNESK